MIDVKNVIRSLRFKFILILVASAAILLCFGKTLTKFNSSDPEPALQDIDIELTRQFAAFTVHVETGLFIKGFSYFSMIENKFVADMLVWFIFNPTEITLDTIDKFSFENGRILRKSPPDIKVMDNKTFVKYDVVAELRSNLNYKKFPLEDHKLSIVLTNNFVTPYEVLFDVLSTDFVVSPQVFVANWNIKRLDTNFGIDENILNQIDKTKKVAYPKAAFIIDFVKAGIRKTFIIFAPIFIVFFFSLFSFFLSIANIIGRATLSVSSLSALLGYRFVIESMMPKVGYFTTTDHIYIILLTFAFLTFILQTVLTRLHSLAMQEKTGYKKKVQRLGFIKDVVFVLTTILSTILICIAIIF